MKYFFILICTYFCINSAAQAQVYFNSGSAKPQNPESMKREIGQDHATKRKERAKRLLVRCQDGSRHTTRVCARHGGVAGR